MIPYSMGTEPARVEQYTSLQIIKTHNVMFKSTTQPFISTQLVLKVVPYTYNISTISGTIHIVDHFDLNHTTQLLIATQLMVVMEEQYTYMYDTTLIICSQ